MSNAFEKIALVKIALVKITEAIQTSELLAALAALNADQQNLLFGSEVRALAQQEIEQLEKQGNQAEHWAQVKVAVQFNPLNVWNNRFLGSVVLGVFSSERCDLGEGVVLPSGVYDSTVSDTQIGNDALVHRVGTMHRTVVMQKAAVASCASVSSSGETTFGCGEELPLGIETGGRDVRCYAEITVGVAEQLARNRSDKKLLKAYESLLEEYLGRLRSNVTIISPGAVVKDTLQVFNSYIGPAAVVSGAGRVAETCLLSSRDEPVVISGGASVKSSIVQWGSSVESMGLVDTSVLCEHSHVERHGKLTFSILGPNSGVGEGEVTASLLGPFVGFHHQALLIAAIWPEGKGNVGYGANIGSNHTGRAPDQEIFCGEGTFFGLGVNVKFPTDLTRSPYSILASGVTCLPQKVEFPFSLINTPAAQLDGISPALNEIMPGWVLAENIYMLKRNESKYAKRNKARRETFIFEIFRPDVIRLVIDAKDRLGQASGKEFYTQRDIPGLGKNYLSEKARTGGVEVYEFYIRYYALSGLYKELTRRQLRPNSPEAGALLREPSDQSVWEHQRSLLGSTKQGDVSELLREYLTMEHKIAQDVERAKSKDDARGQRIIADYAEAHGSATQDAFVQQTNEQYQQLAAEVEKLLDGI